MSTTIIMDSGKIRFMKDLDILPELKKGAVYQSAQDLSGFYLYEVEPFKLPSKLYGDFSVCEKYLKSYQTFDKNLGILLSGMKGAGKTILSKMISIKSGMPTILVDGIGIDAIANLIQNYKINDVVFFFDEFEKIILNLNIKLHY